MKKWDKLNIASVFQLKHHFVKQKLFSHHNIMCKNSEKVINYVMFPSQLLKRSFRLDLYSIGIRSFLHRFLEQNLMQIANKQLSHAPQVHYLRF